MDVKKLTREEIALTILNGIVGSLKSDVGSSGALYVLSDYINERDKDKTRREACVMAYQLADLFIQERDK